MVVFALLLLFLLARPVAGQHIGSKECAKCHAEQFASHARTGHALALSRPADHPLASSFSSITSDWAFGAGDQAVTFVSQLDQDSYLEHGLSYYSAPKSLALTPGHNSAEGERYRTFDPNASILRCFQCHSTGPLTLGENSRIVPAELGVACEACHGPGTRHVQLTGQKDAIQNPGRLEAGKLNEQCGACHRKPPAAGEAINWNNAWNVRHQPLYFSQSACFIQSNGKMSCLTCHPAHAQLSHDSAAYDRRCKDCHAKPQHRTEVAGQSCVGCHMPAVKPQPELRFVNHWIGIYAEGKPLRPIDQP